MLCFRSILILPSHLHLVLSISLFRSNFLTKLYEFILSLMHATYIPQPCCPCWHDRATNMWWRVVTNDDVSQHANSFFLWPVPSRFQTLSLAFSSQTSSYLPFCLMWQFEIQTHTKQRETFWEREHFRTEIVDDFWFTLVLKFDFWISLLMNCLLHSKCTFTCGTSELARHVVSI